MTTKRDSALHKLQWMQFAFTTNDMHFQCSAAIIFFPLTAEPSQLRQTFNLYSLSSSATSKSVNVKEYLNEPDLDQDRPLHLAVETGKVASVELCLKHGAQVNAQRTTLMAPLHIAAMKGDMEIVKILCRNGADLHMKDNEKQTPLHR